MPELSYIIGTWHIVDSGCLEYLFPSESSVWVLEPEGTLTEFSPLPACKVSRALSHNLYISGGELNEFGVFSLDLNVRFWIGSEQAFFRVGEMCVYCQGMRTVFKRAGKNKKGQKIHLSLLYFARSGRVGHLWRDACISLLTRGHRA